MLLRLCRIVAAAAAAAATSASPGVHRTTAPGVVVDMMADAEAAAVAVGKNVLRVLHLLAVNLKKNISVPQERKFYEHRKLIELNFPS